MKTQETTTNLPQAERPEMRQVIINVFHQLQEDAEANLLEYAKSDPDAFYKLAFRLIPAEVKEKANDANAALKKPRSFMRLSDGTELDF
ncbi:MAG: hypothetical protein U0T75_10370 [Chitinophagales bacterium]